MEPVSSYLSINLLTCWRSGESMRGSERERVFVCVGVRERERERERETDRQTDRQRQRQRDTHRQRWGRGIMYMGLLLWS